MNDAVPHHLTDRLTRGELVDLRPEPGSPAPVAERTDWRPEHNVDGSLLAELVTMPASDENWTYRPLLLVGARITGVLDLEAATLTRPLHLVDCFFEQHLDLRDAQANTIYLPGCQVPFLLGSNLRTSGDLRLSNGFIAAGEVSLLGARIGGQLNCSGGTFWNPGGPALNLTTADVAAGVFCENGFGSTGEVRLLGARIGGQLTCVNGTFSNPGGFALNGATLQVAGGVFCRGTFTAFGEVNLLGVRVGGSIELDGGTFVNPEGQALNADRAIVEGNVFCRNNFTATGEVNFLGAHINGTVDCSTGSFLNPDGTALNLGRAEITKEILFRPTEVQGTVMLYFTKAGAWYDSAATWPPRGKLWLLGFTYDAIEASPPIKISQRLDWLRRDAEGFTPQPYEQLATVLRRDGNEHDARTVQISAQWHRRRTATTWADRRLRPLRLAWSALLWATIGYGYRPWRILGPIVLLYTFGWWWFTRAEGQGDIVRARRVDPDVQFSAARYTADLLIPGASLGERSRFIPLDHTAWWAGAYTITGWALAAILVAGLTGILRRQ
jgi:hypothetical protein